MGCCTRGRTDSWNSQSPRVSSLEVDMHWDHLEEIQQEKRPWLMKRLYKLQGLRIWHFMLFLIMFFTLVGVSTAYIWNSSIQKTLLLAKVKEIDELKKENFMKDKEISGLKEEKSAKKKDISEKKELLAKYQDFFNLWKLQQSAKDMEISNLKQEISDLKEEKAAKEKEMSELKKESQKISIKDKEISELNLKLLTKDQAISDLRKQQEAKDDEISKLKDDVSHVLKLLEEILFKEWYFSMKFGAQMVRMFVDLLFEANKAGYVSEFMLPGAKMAYSHISMLWSEEMAEDYVIMLRKAKMSGEYVEIHAKEEMAKAYFDEFILGKTTRKG